MTDLIGAVTSHAYDNADRLVSITAPSGEAITLAHDDAGRRAALTHPNGLVTRYSFDTPTETGAADGSGRLSSIAHGLDLSGTAGVTLLNQRLGTFDYLYDIKGNIAAISESGSVARSRNHTLDTIERLTQVSDPSTGTPVALESYTLDGEADERLIR